MFGVLVVVWDKFNESRVRGRKAKEKGSLRLLTSCCNVDSISSKTGKPGFAIEQEKSMSVSCCIRCGVKFPQDVSKGRIRRKLPVNCQSTISQGGLEAPDDEVDRCLKEVKDLPLIDGASMVEKQVQSVQWLHQGSGYRTIDWKICVHSR